MFYPLNTPETGREAAEEFYSDDSYPKLMYRPAKPVDLDHMSSDPKEMKAEMDRAGLNCIQGYDLETLSVANAAAEEDAILSGWHLTVALATHEIPASRRGRPRKEA